jgi:hypothetical protein
MKFHNVLRFLIRSICYRTPFGTAYACACCVWISPEITLVRDTAAKKPFCRSPITSVLSHGLRKSVDVDRLLCISDVSSEACGQMALLGACHIIGPSQRPRHELSASRQDKPCGDLSSIFPAISYIKKNIACEERTRNRCVPSWFYASSVMLAR